MLLLYLALIVSNLFWLAILIHAFEAKRQMEYLDESGEPASFPKISILVPARNESRILPQTLEALLKSDYPDFEIVVLDDQSEDGTGDIAAEFARRDSRVSVVRTTEPGECWKGKTWALQHGAMLAKGSWLLLTDADVAHHPHLLRAALAKAQHDKVDFLSVFPYVQCESFWEKVMLPSFAVILSMIRPLHKSNDPESPVAIAAGGFILVKSLLFRHIGGFDSIRDSIIEDVKLAELFKNSGYKIKTVLSASHWLTTRMYDSLGAIWEGLSRHAFEGSNHSSARIFGAIFAGLCLNVLPFFTLVLGLLSSNYRLAVLSLIPVCIMAAVQTMINRAWNISWIYCFSFPVATMLYCPILINSLWAYRFGRGNLWKGRRYGRKEQFTAESAEAAEKS